jgi:hypothetical protein
LTPLVTALSCRNRLLLSRQRRLSRAGRTIEDHRPQPIGSEQSAQKLARSEEMLLAHELVKRSRPHAGSQRLCRTQVSRFHIVK